MIRRRLGSFLASIGRAVAGRGGVRGARGSTNAGGPWRRGETAGGDTLRRWEGAETNRLNQAQWQTARDVSLNQDLLEKLPTLRARTATEVARNPIVEGAIETFCTDVVGRNGPTLQVLAGDDDVDVAWCEALEAVWREWFKCPDVAAQLGGVDWLALIVRGMWTNGEFAAQKVTVPTTGPVSLRLKVIAVRRLDTPPELAGDPNVSMGVRRTPEGAPVEYFVADPMPYGYFWLSAPTFTAVPAKDFIHRFLITEEDQVRGVPWLAPSLQSVADLREFDAQVLDAARQAADHAIQLYTEHPDAPFLEIDDQVEIERRTISTLPPGWKPWSATPSQPGPNYLEYRAERQRDVGRPRQMPGMMVRLDSSKHNYSSARFDGQIYVRGLQKVQSSLERLTLNDLVDDIAREAELYAMANPQWEHARAFRGGRPRRVDYKWTWTPPPHVDRQKEAAGERTELENGTLSYPDACAAHGTDEDTQIRTQARTLSKFSKAKVPPPAWLTGQVATGFELSAQLAAQDALELAAEGDHEGSADAAGDAADYAATAKPRAKAAGSKRGGPVDPDQFKASVDAYGVAVRSGSITPQVDDENYFREQLGLPAMSAAAQTAWTQDKGVRRPITLASVADTRAEAGPVDPATANQDDEQ